MGRAKSPAAGKKATRRAAGKKSGKQVQRAAGSKSAAKAASKKIAKKTAKPVAKKAVKRTAKSPAKATAKKAASSKAAQVSGKKTTPAKASPTSVKARPTAAGLARPKHLKLVTDMSSFVTPLDDRVLIRLSGSERTTPSGLLFIPDTVSDTSGNLEGLVVAVGRGRRDKKGQIRPMDVQLGDRAVFSEYAGSKIRVQNEDLVLLRESEVMGVLS